MDSKVLTESGWKLILQKFKIKDNGLQKALANYEDTDEKDFDGRLKCISTVNQLASALKKGKDGPPAPEVVKYLANVTSAADAEKSEVTKLKALAAKTDSAQKKAEADAKKQDAEDDEEAEEEGEYHLKLLTAFKKLKSAKDVSYEFIVCDAKPHVCIMLAKKITPRHKEELTKVSGGSKRFLHLGTCRVEDGKFNFNTDKPVSGLARKLQESVKHFTGKKMPIKVGTESEEGDEEPGSQSASAAAAAASAKSGQAAGAQKPGATPGEKPKEPVPNMTAPLSLTGSVGQGGKNKPEEVQAVQVALNLQAKAGLVIDGKCGTKTITAIKNFQKSIGMAHTDGLIEPGKQTEKALQSGKAPAPAPEPAGKEPAAPSGAKPGGLPGGLSPEAIEAAKRAGKEIVERKAKLDKTYQDTINRLKKAAGPEAQKILTELQKAYNEILGHFKNIEKTAQDLAQRKTQEAAEALKKAAEQTLPGFKIVEEQTQKAVKWVEQQIPGAVAGAKDLAKKVTQEVADRKKQADAAYNDVINKLKKAASDELGDEGKRIRDELEKAYKENQDHVKKVAEAAAALAKRETEAAAQALKQAAEKTIPGFQTVENLAQQASNWWNS